MTTSTGTSRTASLLLGLIIVFLILTIVVAVMSLSQQPGAAPLTTPINQLAANATLLANASQTIPAPPTATPPAVGMAATQAIPAIVPITIPPQATLMLPTPNLTPLPDGLSAPDRALFDRANEQTLNFTSFEYDLQAELSVVMGAENVLMGVSSSGRLNGLSGDIPLAQASLLSIRQEMNGQAMENGLNTLLVGDTIYVEMPAQDAQGNPVMQWVGIPFNDIPADQTLMLPPVDMTIVNDIPQILQIINIGGFAQTTRAADEPNGWQRFTTRADVRAFMNSTLLEDLAISVTALTNPGQPVNQAEISQSVGLLRAQFNGTVQDVQLQFDHYVDPAAQVVRRVTIVFTLTLPLLAEDQTVQMTTMRGDLNLNLSPSSAPFEITPPPGAIFMDPAALAPGS